MAHYKVPGLSVAIISGGKVVWAGGFGVKEAGTTDSVTADDALPGGVDQQAGHCHGDAAAGV